MNKIFLFASRLVSSSPESMEIEVNEAETPDKDKALLDLIYGIDETTGLPCGDLAMYLSPKTNAEVRTFIEMNLLRDNSDGTSQLSLPPSVVNTLRETITDDDIARFSRGGDESREDYAFRIRQFLDSERERLSNERRKKALDADIKAFRSRFADN